MHSGKNRHARVHVVMDLDPRLAVDRSEYATDVLDQATLERDGEREKERIERRAVEALAEEAAGREEDDTIPGSSHGKPVGDQASCLPSYSALEDVRLQAQLLELRVQPCEVLLPAALFGDVPAGLGGDVKAALGGDAAVTC